MNKYFSIVLLPIINVLRRTNGYSHKGFPPNKQKMANNFIILQRQSTLTINCVAYG